MASINEVTIDLKFTGLNNLEQATKKMRQVQTEVKRLAKEEKAGAISTDQYSKRVSQLASELQKSTKGNIAARNAVNTYSRAVRDSIVATEETKRAQQELNAIRQRNATIVALQEQRLREEAKAEAAANAERKRAQQSYNQLRASIDQSYAARMRLKQAADTLRAAERQGIITREQAIEQLRQYRAAAQAAAQGSGFMGRNISKSGVITQQAGYQVGDFIVQVQSGTNAFVAFGQQATQVAGTLTLLGGKFIGIGTVLGIAIPLATALGAAFMRTSKEADSASSDIQNSFSELTGFFDDLSQDISNSFDVAFQKIEDKYGELFSRLADIRLRETKNALTLSFEQNIPQTVQPSFIDRLGAALAPGMVGTSTEALRIVKEQSDALYEEAIAVQEIQNRYVEKIKAASSIQQIVNITKDTEKELAAVSEAAADAFVKQAESAGITGFILEKTKDSYDDILGSAEGLAAAEEALNELYESRLGNIDDTANNYVDILGSAEGLAAAEEALNNLFGQRLKQQQKQQQEYQDRLDKTRQTMGAIRSETTVVTQSVIDTANAMGGTVKDAMRLQEALDSGAISASDLAGVDIAGALTPAVNRARELAKELGISFRIAAAMSGAIVRGADPEALDPRSARYDPNVARAARVKEMMESGELYKDFSNTPSGGGGGGAAGSADNLRQSVDKLIASYDEQYAKSLKVAEATKLMAEAQMAGAIPANMSADKILQDYIASLEDADDTMSQFVNDTASQMSDAFMSIVDGSKSASDAFGDMARAILKQAFELAVINPIINSIFGGVSGFNPLPSLLGSANGNAFSDGRVVPFANGGVVSSPTMFPMRGAQAGLMGEAGPEAIMPLKRGKGGKLGVVAEGASQPVVIHQNFNFSANGDDSVKRIIAQEAPKIASLTQKQILDQRARGGAFKTTFG